jgi:hypothetical protein
MTVQNGDILRVAVRWQWDALHDIINVWHLLVNDTGTATSDEDVMNDIENALSTILSTYMASVPTNVTGVDLSGVNITQDVLLPLVLNDMDGGSLGEGLPLPTTPMIQFHSATPRHGSRIYLPVMHEGTNLDGVMSTGLVDVLEDVAADVLAGLVGGLFGGDFERLAYDRSAGIGRKLTAAFIPATFRTQRRRRQGVGG